MSTVISIGNQDFESIRKSKSFYIDKTTFIKEWWENNDSVTLITRPRRFGKTLNLSTLHCFFSVKYKGRSDLFENLFIWKEKKYRDLQGTYPVIFLSFASVKGITYESARESILLLLEELYQQHSFLLEKGILNPKETEYFQKVGTEMSDAEAAMAIPKLAYHLFQYYKKKVIILLDEYDTPLQEAYVHNYWEQMTFFVRGIFNSAFKTNSSMERGLMTGITRVSKESIFSDLNNLTVVTTTSEKYREMFGFTEKEVFQALDTAGLGRQKQKIKEWYDGFTFGSSKDIYNPWSITNFLDEKKIKLYWANTSSNALISKLLREGSKEIKTDMEALLLRQHIFTILDEQIVFQELDDNEQAIWSLLLASGYLKVERSPEDETDDNQQYELSITNKEVERMFQNMIHGWFKKTAGTNSDFIKALFMNDIEYMNQFMNEISIKMFSSFYVGRHPSQKMEPERFYHGFVLGLIVELADRYYISSNRESGFGRYDVMLEPINKADKAFIFEFKVYNPSKDSDLKAAAENALAQIEQRKYSNVLIERGIDREQIYYYGFAFEGKKVLILGKF